MTRSLSTTVVRKVDDGRTVHTPMLSGETSRVQTKVKGGLPVTRDFW